MIHAALAALLQTAVLSASPLTYEQAFEENAKTGKPLVVLIGAEWCPGCVTMKRSSMPAVAKDAVFGEVAYTVLDTDKQTAIAQQMMQGGSIPQLVMFHKTAAGWQHDRLVGAQSPTAIIQFLRKGIKAATGKIASN
ncbi:MAG: thioredoxin family protein [Planctomycetia bacterium]|nr:thioredoxin family protein [Planctomycetia bacterium]